MTTKIKFDNAQLSDALTKAGRVAPNKGAAFDKAAGFHMTVNPMTQQMVLRATNLETSYIQNVPAVEGTGDEVVWRLPSAMLSSLVASLPMSGTDATTTFIDRGDGYVRVVAGSVKARMNTLPVGEFPILRPFDSSTFKEANEFAAKVNQVAWACDKKSSILSGVHIDGDVLVGCSHLLLATVPCATSVEEPITVPLLTLAPILKSATDVSIGSEANRMLMALDAETQATSQLIEGVYPNYRGIMRDQFLGHVMVRKASLVDAINRMASLFRSERTPTTKVVFDGTGLLKVIHLDVDVSGVGRMMDTIDCLGGDYEDKIEIAMDPTMLLDAVSHSEAEIVKIAFGKDDPSLAWKLPIQISDENNYQCYVMPKKGDA